MPVTGGLLEVVSKDLVELDEALSVALQPAGKAHVKLGASRFGERVIGGIANQEMPKAKAVIPRDLRLVRPDELLSHERGQPRRDLVLFGRKRLHGAAVEHLAFNRAPVPARGARGA